MKSVINRRKALKLAGTASAASLLSAPFVMAQSRPKLTMIAGFDHSLEMLPELNAIAGGHFEAAGVEVESMTVRGTVVAIQQVVTGSAHFARSGALDVMQVVVTQGVPLVSAGVDLHGGIFHIVSSASAPVTSPEDLRGKTIGLKSLAGGQENSLNMLLATAGIPPEEVRREIAPADAGNVEFLKRGQLDAFMVALEPQIILKDSDEDLAFLSINDFAPMPGGVLAANSEAAAADPEATRAFMRGMRASAEEIINGDINEILDRVYAVFEMVGPEDRDFQLKIIDGYKDLMLLKGPENLMRNLPEAWQAAADMAGGAGIIQVDDPTLLYSNDYDQY